MRRLRPCRCQQLKRISRPRLWQTWAGVMRALQTYFYFNEIETGHRALVIFPLAGLKAVCQTHRDCVCWLSEVAAGNPNAMVSLMRWGGAGASTSREEHRLAGAELKRLFGMRPRRGSLG